jgi:hypothetical protein
MESSRISGLQNQGGADVEPNIREVLAISRNKGDRRDPRNEADENIP